MAEKFAKYWLTKSDSKAKIISCVAGSITVTVKKLPLKNTSLGLMMHYWCGRGEPMTLSEIGVKERVISLVQEPNQLGKKGGHSVYKDFITQILKQNVTSFKNSYTFRSVWDGVVDIEVINDPLWAIGSATLSGKFFGRTINENGKYYLKGRIDYEFYDEFSDPYDILNFTQEKWDPNGNPFDIIDKWSIEIKESITKEEAFLYRALVRRSKPKPTKSSNNHE
ncbi:hypothetical protein [Actinobacillus lignieresii]|nr:hypothetical protein [Actinobacillus lignieresii]